MKKSFSLILGLLISFSFLIMSSCEEKGDSSFENIDTIKLTDFQLPNSFALTYRISDTKILNPGDPWYYRTAKIENDWQIIECDREENYNNQKTHFLKYITNDEYAHYTFNYVSSTWEEANHLSFNQMVNLSLPNFSFLYVKPTGLEVDASESEVKYDTDPTSNENLIDALRYEYSAGLNYEYVVDKLFPNICLSETVRDNSTICINNDAYEYIKSIEAWDSYYMSSRFYRSFSL